MALKDNIKIKRLEKDMTLEELANKVGTTRQTIQKYESGVIANIPSDKIEKMAEALEVSPAYLMGWEENKTTANVEAAEKKKQIDTVAAHLEDKNLTPKKLKLLQNYIDALFDEEEDNQ